MNILQAIDNEELFAPWFKDQASWKPWRAFLAALFALPMDDEMLALYRKHTGRSEPPTERSDEAWLICGRRAGKSFIMALVAVYLAAFVDYAPYLQPGERATIPVMASDRRQARSILRYVQGMLTRIPVLANMVQREWAEGFDLNNDTTIEIGTASMRASRGYTFACALGDEVAFWRDDNSANPDEEILDAVRPGMATIPGAMLICASSPYARRGALFEAWRRWWGKADAPLVWRATSREMNPSIPQKVIDRAIERDPQKAAAEYLAEFRSDLEALFTREAVESVLPTGIVERQWEAGHTYFGFVDPSGGSSDAMTMAIAHTEYRPLRPDQAGPVRMGRKVLLDVVREVQPPFSPDGVAQEFSALLKTYGLHSVTGDRYGGEWPRERFAVHGVRYHLAEATRSDLYLALLPAVNAKTIELLDLPHLTNQLIALERRVHRGGRDLVDHPVGGHDDVANAAAGAAWMARDKQIVAPTALTGTFQTVR